MSTRLPTEQEKAEFLKRLTVDDAEVERIRNLPQRSKEWLACRQNRLTASNFGAALGRARNKKQTPKEALRDLLCSMLWGGTIPNDAMIYGTVCEPLAFEGAELCISEEFKALGYRDVWLEETGLVVCKEHPWLGASSDGLFFARGGPAEDVAGTIEIKCPPGRKFYPETPPYYYDQFQGTAAILGLNTIRFVVYTPNSTQYNTYATDWQYWNDTLFPGLKHFYMEEFLPRRIWQEWGGIIEKGEIDPRCTFTALSMRKRKKEEDEEE